MAPSAVHLGQPTSGLRAFSGILSQGVALGCDKPRCWRLAKALPIFLRHGTQRGPPWPADSTPGAAAGAVGFQIVVAPERLCGSRPRPAQNGVHRGLRRLGVLLRHGDIEQRLRWGGGHSGVGDVTPGLGKSNGLNPSRRRKAPQHGLASRSQEQDASGERRLWVGCLAHFHPALEHRRDADGCLKGAEVRFDEFFFYLLPQLRESSAVQHMVDGRIWK